MSVIKDFLGKSARENVEHALRLAEENLDYNIFINLTSKRALERADAVDRGEIKGKLAGVPFAVKDNFLSFGAPTTAASRMLENFEAPYQATAIERLEAEGAICIGKTNLDSFAHGGSTENSAFGPTLNAFDKSKVAGGSSGGSAVSVARGVVPFALGSDTGGSIRQPAGFNGVIGVKPTYGRVSRYGVIAMANSTDTVGCFTNSLEDANLVMDIISGYDSNDRMTASVKSGIDAQEFGKRIAVINQQFNDKINPEVYEAIDSKINLLNDKGYQVDKIDLPIIDYALAMYYIITSAEVSSNMARFDGVRYGYRSEKSNTLKELYSNSRDEGFEAETKRRILVGSYVLSSGFYDAYYEKAQRARRLLVEAFENTFKKYDVIIGPVTPDVAFKIGEKIEDPVSMYLSDVMTVPASLAGLPAISVPAGKDNLGLPIGLQLVANRNNDNLLYSLAEEIIGGSE